MTVGYDGKPLIKDITLNVKKGEILTLIGPNGAGKSTILKSIIGQLSLIAGTVLLDGESIERMEAAELAKKMSVVLTEQVRTELMTCEDVVETLIPGVLVCFPRKIMPLCGRRWSLQEPRRLQKRIFIRSATGRDSV